MEPSKLTVRLLEKLSTEPGARVFDSETPGLFVEVGAAGAVRFRYKTAVRKGPKGGPPRKASPFKRTLGVFPEMTLDEARKEATRLRSIARDGRDPRTGTVRAPGMWTVEKLRDEYVKDRLHEKRIARRTIADIEKRFRLYLAKDIVYLDTENGVEISKSQVAWSPLPLMAITPEFARERHIAIARNHGPVAANDTLKNFRTMYNWAIARQSHLGLPSNPTTAVTFIHQPERTESLQLPELPAWWRNLQLLENPIRRLFHVINLFSGMRPGALAKAERSWLRLAAKALIIPMQHNRKGKKGIGREVHIPLSRFMLTLFERLLAINDVLFPGIPFLFPTRSGKLRNGSVIPLAAWREDDLEYGYTLRHYYSNVCAAAGVSSTHRMLLMAQTLPGIEGTYLNQPFLFKTLLGEQERATAYLLKGLKIGKGTSI